ncbi:MAG: PAS domain-containing protein [bacterium]
MDSSQKEKELSLQEIDLLRARVAELESREAERERAEAAAQESETRYRQLFMTLSSGVAVYEATNNGADFTILDMNRAGEKICRVAKEDVIDRPVTEAFPGVKEFGLFEVFQEVWKDGKPRQHSTSLYKDNRISIWVENSVYKLPSGQIVAVFDDVTERKGAEEALRKSEAFLNSVFEHSPYPMWISDERGTLIRLNRACRDMLSITEEEVVGRYNILKDNIVEEQGHLPLVREVFEKGKTVQFNIEYDTSAVKHLSLERQAIKILDVTISPVENEKGTIANAIVQHIDITEQRRAEEDLRNYRLHLEEMVRERTAELRKLVKLMAGREVRMAELKEVIMRLRGQIEKAGMTPVANDPLKEPISEESHKQS